MTKDSEKPLHKRYVTAECYLSFPYLDTPKTYENDGKETYAFEACFVFSKSEQKDEYKRIKQQINAACAEKWGDAPKKWPHGIKKWYKSDKFSIKDGDGMDLEKYPDYENKFYLSARSRVKNPNVIRDRERVRLVDKYNRILSDPEDLHPGCKVIALLDFYAWKHPVAKEMVSVDLLGVMKKGEGENWGGGVRADAEDIFADEAETTDEVEGFGDV